MCCLGTTLSLLALTAGMFLLLKTKKEEAGIFFKLISYLIVAVSLGCLVCCLSCDLGRMFCGHGCKPGMECHEGMGMGKCGGEGMGEGRCAMGMEGGKCAMGKEGCEGMEGGKCSHMGGASCGEGHEGKGHEGKGACCKGHGGEKENEGDAKPDSAHHH